jgi:hypothetical protein
MEIPMKKILKLILISLSIVSTYSYGGLDSKKRIESNQETLTKLLLAEKASQSGVVFSSNGVEYQLILGGKAVMVSNITNKASASLSNNSIWSDQLGGYQLSITNDISNGLNSSLSNDIDNVNYKLIAYNSSNGGIGIIQGEIIVKLHPYYNAETIARTYNINLTSYFELISTAMYRVNKGQDIFAIAKKLSKHPGVEFAELDVIEGFASAM